MTRTVAAIAVVLSLALPVPAGATAAEGAPYYGSARSLALTAEDAGFAVIQSSSAAVPAGVKPAAGVRSRWVTSYSGVGNREGTALVQVLVFESEAAAGAHFGRACPGACSSGTDAAGWRYKSATVASAGGRTAVVLGVCHNITVTVEEAAPASVALLTRASKFVVWMIMDQAVQSGMDSCISIAADRRAYWTENEAEQRVRASVRIPDCLVYEGPGCARRVGDRPSSAECTGADEYDSTFTYPRFTCAIVINDGYGRPRSRGRIAVFPTGATFRWVLL